MLRDHHRPSQWPIREAMSLLPLEDSCSVVVIWKSGGKEALELHPSIGEEGSTKASNSFFMIVDSFLH